MIGTLNGEVAVPLGVPEIAVHTKSLTLAFPNGVLVKVGSEELSALRRKLQNMTLTPEQMSDWTDEQRVNRIETVSRLKRSIEAATYACLNDFGIRHLGGHRFEVIADRFVPWPEPAGSNITAAAAVAA